YPKIHIARYHLHDFCVETAQRCAHSLLESEAHVGTPTRPGLGGGPIDGRRREDYSEEWIGCAMLRSRASPTARRRASSAKSWSVYGSTPFATGGTARSIGSRATRIAAFGCKDAEARPVASGD